MKAFIAVLMVSLPCFAGSSYEYIGRAKVVSVARYSKSELSLDLAVEKILAINGSANLTSPGPREYEEGKAYYAIVKVSEASGLKVGDTIFFSSSWSCGKDGCSKKHWSLMSEDQAKLKAAL